MRSGDGETLCAGGQAAAALAPACGGVAVLGG